MAHSKFSLGKVYERMIDDLHLAGFSERTHNAYLRAVRRSLGDVSLHAFGQEAVQEP